MFSTLAQQHLSTFKFYHFNIDKQIVNEFGEFSIASDEC